VIVYIVPAVIVTIAFIPPLEYQIKNSQGRYPTVRELGASVWVSESSDVRLTMLDGYMNVEISSNGIKHNIRGYLFKSEIGFCDTLIDEASKNHIDKEVYLAEFEYYKGEIKVSNGRNLCDDFSLPSEFTLKREKDLDINLVQKYQCKEVNMYLDFCEETDFYAEGKLCDVEDVEITLEKRKGNYYFLWVDTKREEYVFVGTLKKVENGYSFEVLFVEEYLSEGVNIYNGPLASYFSEEVKTLTFSIT
jgi:hypothetical protein